MTWMLRSSGGSSGSMDATPERELRQFLLGGMTAPLMELYDSERINGLDAATVRRVWGDREFPDYEQIHLYIGMHAKQDAAFDSTRLMYSSMYRILCLEISFIVYGFQQGVQCGLSFIQQPIEIERQLNLE
ncbi:hypothetical protein [Paenibacillus sp. EZ-K15]|uniref:hypothetical protein n=1 Tax=Paenibacillus sp. EZ-K15 TaxID=2044275 RepID=UPI001F2BC8A8|nr:hypothetical protein [Paenibacillus sp. EZ-K15]